jgi:hypothetical protein
MKIRDPGADLFQLQSAVGIGEVTYMGLQIGYQCNIVIQDQRLGGEYGQAGQHQPDKEENLPCRPAQGSVGPEKE